MYVRIPPLRGNRNGYHQRKHSLKTDVIYDEGSNIKEPNSSLSTIVLHENVYKTSAMSLV